ncbi:hypothetical protein P3X46_027953 [Hevea brasiliensis]|uniref:Pentacotripeptide-repeat region of PRORP domain-containing protein n=1 Tax=Hevea brasiliensis TaxID=3981 RepID=A0ABQ9L1G4_HEVBR|nr:hypothetical protein P3X46_027953 [Hevea brasiliensis]
MFLVVKGPQPSIPFVLNTNPILNPNNKPQIEQNQVHLKEFDVVKRLKNESSIPIHNPFQHTPLTYHTMIEKLGVQRDVDGVQYLLQLMKLEGISCSEDLFISVINTYRRNWGIWLKPTVKIYNHLLDALRSENRFQMINPIYSSKKRDGMEPNVYTYDILLKGLCKNNRVDGACKFLVQMSDKGCNPDVISYTTVISSMCKIGKVEEARDLAMKFQPSVPVYNALINGFYRGYKNKGKVFRLLGLMADEGIDANVITYSKVINSLSDMGIVELALAFWAKMLVAGCRPNVHTFTSLMKDYFMGGRVYEALNIWNQMIQEEIEANIVGYNALIHEALSVSCKMEGNGCSPNVITYSALIDGFAKAGDLVGASETWNKVMVNDCIPNVVVHTGMLDKMTTDDCPPNTVTFNAFIKGLCRSGRVEWALKMFNKMGQYGCSPNVMTYNEILDGLLKANRIKEALELVREMEDNSVKLNSVTYNTILCGFCLAGLFEETSKLLGKNAVIYAYCKQGKVKATIQLVDRVSAGGERKPDIIAYTNLLWGICNQIGVEEAFMYLGKMLSKGICPSVAIWNVLVRGLFHSLGHLGPIYILDDILAHVCQFTFWMIF